MRFLSLLSCFVLFCAPVALARTVSEIVMDNARSIVFLQVLDATGAEVDSGSGFIVSHDGFIITAAHVKPTNGQKLVAVIGQRSGTSYQLEFRDSDEQHDVALWQLPQSSVCRYTVVLSSKPIDEFGNFVAMGFPGGGGLSREPLKTTNKQSALGFYKTDGQLENGYSGGPMFNESGHVVGFVQGGTVSGARSNDIVADRFRYRADPKKWRCCGDRSIDRI